MLLAAGRRTIMRLPTSKGQAPSATATATAPLPSQPPSRSHIQPSRCIIAALVKRGGRVRTFLQSCFSHPISMRVLEPYRRAWPMLLNRLGNDISPSTKHCPFSSRLMLPYRSVERHSVTRLQPRRNASWTPSRW